MAKTVAHGNRQASAVGTSSAMPRRLRGRSQITPIANVQHQRNMCPYPTCRRGGLFDSDPWVATSATEVDAGNRLYEILFGGKNRSPQESSDECGEIWQVET